MIQSMFNLSHLGSLIVSILSSDLWKLLALLVNRFPQLAPGAYAVLRYKVELELLDKNGKKAIHRQIQHVKYLQDNVIAYYDSAWGDGNIFANYSVSPGIAVDKFRSGYHWQILISRRETKSRGDKDVLHINREIHDGFCNQQEDFTTDINHKTNQLELRIIFPKQCHPYKVVMIEQNINRTTILGNDHLNMLPDGRLQVVWKTKRPRRFETYTMRWIW